MYFNNYKSNVLILLFLIIFFFLNLSVFTEDIIAPAVILDPANPEDISDPHPDPRMTEEEFSNLPDDEKRNIYFNFPNLLPENFSFDLYMHIFYPEFEETEN